MTKEEKRIAVAEKLGWTRITKGMVKSNRVLAILNDWDWHGTPPHEANLPEDDQSFVIIPNYPDSRDTCAEFEETLMETGKMGEYVFQLEEATNIGHPNGNSGRMPLKDMILICADGDKRCDAFLNMI